MFYLKKENNNGGNNRNKYEDANTNTNLLYLCFVRLIYRPH